MRPVTEHPGKMWRVGVGATNALPLLPFDFYGTPWHSSPTQELPTVFVQTGALEMAWSYVIQSIPPTIAGALVRPWYAMDGAAPESIDINTPEDWQRAEQCAERFPEWLPKIEEMAKI